MSERLVVIGGDAAGMTTASQARRRRGPDDLQITVFELGNHTSYSACGIPYFIGGAVENFDDLIVRTPAEFRSDQQIDVHTRHVVTEIDLDARRVRVRDLDAGEDRIEPFDQLMYAAGGAPIRPDLPGIESQGIFGVQILDHAAAIDLFIRTNQPRRAVVVGGGYIGLEMAEAFVMKGMEVTLIEQADQPMTTLDPDMGGLVRDALVGLGVTVHTEEAVESFEESGGRVSGVVTADRTVPADIVTLGLGTRPNVALAERGGIPLGESGAIAVDDRMRTKVEGVWAAGDCAEKRHRMTGKGVAIALGTHANKEGRVAGINIGGGDASFPGVVGTAVSKICGVEVARTGLAEREAEAAGFSYVTATTDSTTRAGYFPGTSPIRTKLVAERGSGRLLGAQIVGKEGAAKRIDTLAAALWNEMTVGEMVNMDLSYAPPFAPVWDPVLIAARKAQEAVERAT